MISCIIVDDEPLARQLLQSYIEQIPDMICMGVYDNALTALAAINRSAIDILFLDIELPGINGIDFVRSVKNKSRVVFITAYPEYAVDAFELEALDYLVKPVSFDRFLKSVQKLSLPDNQIEKGGHNSLQNNSCFLKVDKRLIKVNFSDIRYIEALGDYLKVHTSTVLVSYISIGRMEAMLPESLFIRIHRSTIVNVNSIEYIEGNFVKVSGIQLPIGLTYKADLLKKLC